MLVIEQKIEKPFPNAYLGQRVYYLVKGNELVKISDKEAKRMVAAGEAQYGSVLRRQEKERTQKHCQVCGRQIEANTGVIAHHGYTRPGGGWQTESCVGARHKPYEESWLVLPEVISQVEEYLKGQQTYLKTLNKNPPVGFWCIEQQQFGRNFTEKCNVQFTIWKGNGELPNYEWKAKLKREISKAEYEIKAAKQQITHFTKRLKAWKLGKEEKQ